MARIDPWTRSFFLCWAWCFSIGCKNKTTDTNTIDTQPADTDTGADTGVDDTDTVDTAADLDTAEDTALHGECADAIPCDGGWSLSSSKDMETIQECSSVGGFLYVQYEDWITDFELPCLLSLGEQLNIRDNDALLTFGFENLTSVGSYIYIWENGLLTDFSMESLTMVGGYL